MDNPRIATAVLGSGRAQRRAYAAPGTGLIARLVRRLGLGLGSLVALRRT